MDPNMDGVDQWDMISKGAPSAREEFVYNLDPLTPQAGIRMGDWKLILGDPGPFPGWPPVPHDDEKIPENITDIIYDLTRSMSTSLNKTQLFNIAVDPTEHHEISVHHPDIVEKLRIRISEYWKTMAPPRDPYLDPAADPANFNGYWSPGWC